MNRQVLLWTLTILSGVPVFSVADPDPSTLLRITTGPFPSCNIKNAIPPAIFVGNASPNRFIMAKINIHQVLNGQEPGTDTEIDRSITPGKSIYVTCEGAFWPPNGKVTDTVQIISAAFE